MIQVRNKSKNGPAQYCMWTRSESSGLVYGLRSRPI